MGCVRKRGPGRPWSRRVRRCLLWRLLKVGEGEGGDGRSGRLVSVEMRGVSGECFEWCVVFV